MAIYKPIWCIAVKNDITKAHIKATGIKQSITIITILNLFFPPIRPIAPKPGAQTHIALNKRPRPGFVLYGKTFVKLSRMQNGKATTGINCTKVSKILFIELAY